MKENEYIIMNGIKYRRTNERLTASEMPNAFEVADREIAMSMEEEKTKRRPTCIDYPDCHPTCRANCFS